MRAGPADGWLSSMGEHIMRDRDVHRAVLDLCRIVSTVAADDKLTAEVLAKEWVRSSYPDPEPFRELAALLEGTAEILHSET